MQKVRLITLLTAVLLTVAPAFAQEKFPAKPVEIYVPFPPGGSHDLHARVIAPAISEIVGQPVLIINKPGAGGAIARREVASSTADGYKLLLDANGMHSGYESALIRGQKPTYSPTEFRGVARVALAPFIVAVGGSKPWMSMADLISDARKRPEQIRYASSGNYGFLHLGMALIAMKANIELLHVPFQGGGPGLTAVIGGHVDAMLVNPDFGGPHIQSKALRPLAVTTGQRSPELPDVPTLRELGHDVELEAFWGVYAGRGLPDDRVRVIDDAVRRALDRPETRAGIDRLKSQIAYLDARAFDNYNEKEWKKTKAIVKAIGKVD